LAANGDVVRLVADTHALVWHLTEPARLGKAARRGFASSDQGRSLCYIPAIALVEIWLLYERGRLRVGPAQILESIAGHGGYAILALDMEQALEFGSLSGVRDPMDRMIVSAARATGSRLISRDEALDGLGVERIWD
jgi:PIN domain nuclease of toxin-antitoxin system